MDSNNFTYLQIQYLKNKRKQKYHNKKGYGDEIDNMIYSRLKRKRKKQKLKFTGYYWN